MKPLLAALALSLTACAAGPNPLVGQNRDDRAPAGFWLGVWHGAISPVTFWVSLFTARVNVYDVFNTGHWYDFGFGCGVTLLLGGGRRAARWRAPADKIAPPVS